MMLTGEWQAWGSACVGQIDRLKASAAEGVLLLGGACV